jgi:hypothetical protein
MSAVERLEIPTFIATWSVKPKSQAVEELASYSLETKRIPDPYSFLIDSDGDLFSPSAGYKVRDFIKTNHVVGERELTAFNFINDWVKKKNSGSIAWISPPYPGVYPTSKVIISDIEVENGIKKVFNRAIVLDIDENDCLKFAQALSQYSFNKPFLNHSEDLRSIPIVLDTYDKSWVDIFVEILGENSFLENIKTGNDWILKWQALYQAEQVLASINRSTVLTFGQEKELGEKIMGMLGQKSGSCPVLLSPSGRTAFQVFSENALTYTGSTNKDPDFCRSCPVCKEEINCIVRSGQSCPKCRAVKRCS